MTGTREQRRRLLPARLVVYFVLALWLFRGRNCGYGQVMSKLADGLYHQRRGADLLAGQLQPDGWVGAGQGLWWRQPNISNSSRGRGSSGRTRCGCCSSRSRGRRGRAGAPGVFCCGLRIVSMDGSVTDVPDGEANVKFFGRPSNQSRDGAFPQVRWVVAAESGTGSLLGAAMGAYRTAEQPLARDLLGCFGPGMLVLADRKFLSWSLARDFLATGAHILWRASASFALKPVKVLADGTYLAELRPPRKSDGPVITVRVIEYTVLTAPEGGGPEEVSEVFCLVTSLLDPEEHPALDLACCYPDRWGCETVIGRHKIDMGEGQPVLRSRPRGRHAGNVGAVRRLPGITKIIGIGATAMGIPPARISFPHAWQPRRTPFRLSPPDQLDLALATFLLRILMPGSAVRDRPDRNSPRRSKKACDFPARKPGEPSVTNVTRRIQFHLLSPRMII